MKSLAKLGMLALTNGTLALGSAALLYQPVHAAPQPECGPTRPTPGGTGSREPGDKVETRTWRRHRRSG
jgi:hypothetical protein